MINYKFEINYKIKSMWDFIFCSYNSIATRAPLKDLIRMLCFQYFISQTI
jgi:hypothetical protein